jgi:hypothetical protein
MHFSNMEFQSLSAVDFNDRLNNFSFLSLYMFSKLSKHYPRFGLMATMQVSYQAQPGSRTGESLGQSAVFKFYR